jgi:putative ABC transport system permease protein
MYDGGCCAPGSAKSPLRLRQLGDKPGFSSGVILTLALAIAATTAVFSLVEGILLRPLPFREPDRLVLLGDHIGNIGENTPVTAREIGTYTSATSAFSSMGAYIPAAYELSGPTAPETIRAARVTASTSPTLGVNPILGRTSTDAEHRAAHPLAVLSYSMWLDYYHRDPQVIGTSIASAERAWKRRDFAPDQFGR